ncbi:hypothetical protein TNCV_2113771 [Trichonephila clavipes]|nr:hypothetical protein TNCV_2113771 [Trichonephila clavipes]
MFINVTYSGKSRDVVNGHLFENIGQATRTTPNQVFPLQTTTPSKLESFESRQIYCADASSTRQVLNDTRTQTHETIL